MAKENGIVVGTVTANLLWALKDIETARNHYYIATETMRGDPDNLTDNMTVEEKAMFDNARDLVEKNDWGQPTDMGQFYRTRWCYLTPKKSFRGIPTQRHESPGN